MIAIETLFSEPAAQAIGWALLHFTWQGALIGVLAAIALRLLRGSAADVRYVVSAIALSLMATMPIVTGLQAYKAATAAVSIATEVSVGAPVSAASAVAPAGGSAGQPGTSAYVMSPTSTEAPVSRSVDKPGAANTIDSALANVEPWLPMLVMIWIAGVVVLTLRLLGGWIWVQRMKSHGATEATGELQAMVQRLSKRLHISRRVRLLRVHQRSMFRRSSAG